MTTMRVPLTTLVCKAIVLSACGSGPAPMPDIAGLSAQPELRDPLVMLDGQRIATPDQWRRWRRPELQALFQNFMYGRIPASVVMQATLVGAYPDFLGGKATLKVIALAAPDGGPVIDLMLVVPNERAHAAPVFLTMNFCGNHALATDPRVPLARGWLYDSCQGCTDHAATEASRGGQAADWPLLQLLERGYAVASFCSSDVDADRADTSDGLYAWLARGDAAPNRAADRGSIAAWAWGFHRCVDYLVGDSDIDAQHIAAVGHSRNGKTALLAAAFDERIALAIPHQAGCGGSAPSRVAAELGAPQADGRPIAETIALINANFPHWFNAEWKRFVDVPEKLPFDQHELVALCAPRPVLFSNAEADRWANPEGQFAVLQAADPVYRLLGVPGLAGAVWPGSQQLVGGRLGFYIRPGHHSMTAGDWQVFADFADRQWGAVR